jgi:phosphoribosylamine--glycine ligase
VKILVIGSGGREHALCWKISQSPLVKALYAIPGNPGIAQLANCLDTTDYVAAAAHIQPDLTVVGPEAPLVAGIVDGFREQGLAIVGPSAAAAQLESSKAFAKEFMQRLGIPTARHVSAQGFREAHEALRGFSYPVVLKADGLAAGKGVVIAHDQAEAEQAIPALLTYSTRLVIEEFLTGEEVSFIVLSDGRRVVALEPSQDHKAVHDNDEGPNTGGMGAYSDVRILSEKKRSQVLETIIEPAIAGMSAEGRPFTGFLYAGLMLTKDGPKVLEFNVRLGDPETQALLPRLESDLVPAVIAAAQGELDQTSLHWKMAPAVCVVLAAAGYPGPTRTGDPITGIEDVTDAVVFQASTKRTQQGLVTNGGRVLGVTASGLTLPTAIETAYREAEKIRFEGLHYRKDIGRKGLQRWQQVAS